MKFKNRKTISDVRRKDVIVLAEASIDLLAAARMMYWMGEHDKDKDDPSFLNALEAMEAALARIGLPQGTTPEFFVRLEGVLRSEPKDFLDRLDGIEKTRAAARAARAHDHRGDDKPIPQ